MAYAYEAELEPKRTSPGAKVMIFALSIFAVLGAFWTVVWFIRSYVEQPRIVLRAPMSLASKESTPAPAPPHPADGEATHETRMLDMLSGVAEKAFELGRGADAERILRRPLEAILARVEEGAPCEAREAADAGLLAVRLARATGQAVWIDFVIRMYAALRRLPTTGRSMPAQPPMAAAQGPPAFTA